MNNFREFTYRDEIDWLIILYKEPPDEEIKQEAYEKLVQYGLTEEEINERFKHLTTGEAKERAFEKAMRVYDKENETLSFTTGEKIQLFFFSALNLLWILSDLIEYKRDNYKTLFKQQLLLLIASILFWITFAIAVLKYSEMQWMEEIEKTDISEWERNRIK